MAAAVEPTVAALLDALDPTPAFVIDPIGDVLAWNTAWATVAGGLVGYFGYETVRHIEPRALSGEKPDALGTPDMLLLVSDELAVLDNVLGKLYLVVYADPQQADALRLAKHRLASLQARLTRPLPELRTTSPISTAGKYPSPSWSQLRTLASMPIHSMKT